MPLVNCILSFLKHVVLLNWCYLFLKFVVYDPKMPRWVEPMPSPKPYEPESFRESYSSGILLDKISTLQLHQKREVKWKVMHGRSGSRPWAFAFMPMDPMWNLSSKLLVNDINPLVISSSCIYVWSFAIMVPTISSSWFLFSDMLEYLPSADQYACPTYILICLLVLPPWYLEDISYEFVMK